MESRLEARLIVCVSLAATLALSRTSVLGDTLHLKNGNRIAVERYWISGEQVFYEKNGSKFGFPKKLLDRVERDGPAAPAAEHTTGGFQNRDRVEALEKARTAADAGNLDEAARQYRTAISAEPQLAEGHVELGELYLTQGKLGAAQAEFEQAKRLTPQDAKVRELLGEVYYRRGRASLAIREWQKALEIAPSPLLLDKLKRALRDNQDDVDFDEVRGTHFVLKYDGIVNEAIGREIALALEKEYADLALELAFQPREPIRVTLYTNQEFFDVTHAPSWVSALNDGDIRIPVQGLTSLNDKVSRVLRHELTHSFVNARTGGNCPAWFQEGLAQLRASESPADLYERLREARDRKSLPPLWSLEGPFLNLGVEEARLAYLTSLAATKYLVERKGQRVLTDILIELGGTRSMNEALQRTIGLDYQALETVYEKDLDRYRPAP